MAILADNSSLDTEDEVLLGLTLVQNSFPVI